MKLSKEKVNAIRQYIIEKVDAKQKGIAKSTSDAFGISEMTVYRYLRALQDDGILEKRDGKYHLKTQTNIYRGQLQGLSEADETRIFREALSPFINDLPDNVQHIWEYCFTEMINNVIDHSEGTIYEVYVSRSFLKVTVLISDNGVGIFRKITDYYQYNSIDDAILELFKGKLTTDSSKHTGEGIFFTSQVLDRFAAYSDGKVFTRNKYDDFYKTLAPEAAEKFEAFQSGTVIAMDLSNTSNKELVEVFDRFSDENDKFTKTRIPLKNVYDTFPVSRSQAKRLSHRFKDFTEVVLDFSEISQIGQGFAHELFVLFRKSHPDVKLVPVNANESVQKMINHVSE